MLRVLHASTVHRPDDVRILHKECRSLVSAGHDVTFLVAGTDDTPLFGVKRVSLGQFRNRRQRMLFGPLRVCRYVLATRPDVVHLHDPELVPVACFLRAATKSKIVVDVHEDLRLQVKSKPWIPALLRRPMAALATLLDAVAAVSAHWVVAATPAIARRFPVPKVTVIHNFPRSDEWPDVQPLRWAERSDELLFVGGLTSIRGAGSMLDALLQPALRGRRLLVVGQLDGAVASLLSKHPARDRVTVTGWLSRAEMAPILATRGRVGLVLFLPVPNHTEALPNKLFEYMAWGLPVVASDFPAWRDILLTAGAGVVVDPAEPGDIARAVAAILEDKDTAEAMANAGPQAVRTMFGWEQEGARLVDLYSRLL